MKVYQISDQMPPELCTVHRCRSRMLITAWPELCQLAWSALERL